MGITTGSIMNNRVYGGGSGSSNKGSGVQRNALLQTRIQLADRNKPSGRTSYTAMSRQINGRAVIVNTGSAGCCHGTQKMSTAEKIAMFNAIATSGLALAKGIGDLVSAGKANKTKTPSDIEKLNQQGNAKGTDGTSNTTSTGNASLNSIANDIKLSGDGCISKMEGATTSADLQAAIKDAESYMNGDLLTSRNQAKGKADVAQKKLDEFKENKTIENAEKDVKTAEQNVKTAKDGVSSFESKIAKEERNIQEANSDLAKADGNYKKAMDDTAKGKADLIAAKEGVTAAKGNVATAEASVNTLETQLASATPEQKPAIETQLNAAKQKLTEAKEELVKAEEQETKAQSALEGFEKAEADALNNVDSSKKGVKEAKEKLADSKEKLEGAKKNHEAKQKELEANQKTLQEKQDALKDLENQKTQAEADVEKFNNLDKEYNSLKSEITEQKARLTKMSQAEAKKMDKLDTKIGKAEVKSHNAEAKMNLAGQAETGHVTTKDEMKAKKRMDKAEANEAELRAKKGAIEGSHVSVDDIKLGEDISKALDACANSAHFGLGGMMSRQLVNGHTVTSQNGQFFIDGSKFGVDRAEAEKLLKQ